MIIIEDTRNQVGKHKAINEYLQEQGHTVIRSKLLVGDYMIANQGHISVDTKMSVMELMMDVWQDHERFRRELQLARDAGIQLVVLTEEALPDGGLDEWQPPVFTHASKYHYIGEPMSKGNPKALRKALITMTHKYGCIFRFCDKTESGPELMRYLGGDFNGKAKADT